MGKQNICSELFEDIPCNEKFILRAIDIALFESFDILALRASPTSQRAKNRGSEIAHPSRKDELDTDRRIDMHNLNSLIFRVFKLTKESLYFEIKMRYNRKVTENQLSRIV